MCVRFSQGTVNSRIYFGKRFGLFVLRSSEVVEWRTAYGVYGGKLQRMGEGQGLVDIR